MMQQEPLSAFGDESQARPQRLPEPKRRPRYSGSVVVRLARDFAATPGEDLTEIAATRDELGGLYQLLADFKVASRRVVRSLAPEKLLKLERKAAASKLRPLHSLTSYWRLDFRRRWDQAAEVVARLNELPEVDFAYRELLATDPDVNAADDPYAAGQGYLDAADLGIDARWVWGLPGLAGEGIGVNFIDLEQGWLPNHEDLVGQTPTLIYGDNRHSSRYHGSAVLGEVLAEDNTVGVVGIAPHLGSVRMVSHYDAASGTSGHVADALVAAIAVLDPGDVVLLEVQNALYPTEIDDANFDAIRLAVALGINVIEAAGNGAYDLDAYTDVFGDHIFDRGSAEFRESGAVMVAAAEPTVPHDRVSGVGYASNYGSRIDCYGWGKDVVSCGYGDLDNGGGDDNRTYTDTFKNTSAASPMIAGAAILLQAMYRETTGTSLSPGQMRALLSDPATGTPQGIGLPGNIGVMPDLQAITTATLHLVPDIYLRDNTSDTGEIPHSGSIGFSPDVIVRPDPVPDPVAAFGEGSGTENSNTLGSTVEAGQDNYIYVRIKNRGASDAAEVVATIYWSPLATVATPANWHLIGSTAPIDVGSGDSLFVTDALIWPAAEIPAPGSYCFVGMVHHPQDEAPPVPGPMDWDAYYSLIRNHNNVTWRNIHVVDDIPDGLGDPARLPFLLTAAMDRARFFDLEVEQRLPRGAQVWLEVPMTLSRALSQGRFWEAEEDRERKTARIRLPRQPRTIIRRLRLPAGARFPLRFLVQGTKAMLRGGNSLAIRQLYDGDEVGRVSWLFERKRQRDG